MSDINFSALSSRSLVGRLARWPLRFLPGRAVVPILQGRLRGWRWIVGAGNHGFWLGSYELPKRLAFERVVKPDMVVYDIGAHAGFYTLLASVLVGPRGRVYAFEPLPENLHFLERHLALNRVGNAEVVAAAVSATDGVGWFRLGPNRLMGRLDSTGSLGVRVLTLDAFARRGGVRPPNCLKIDVEGAELDVLRGALATLKTYRPFLFVATHGAQVHSGVVEFLRNEGYSLSALDKRHLAASREILAVP